MTTTRTAAADSQQTRRAEITAASILFMLSSVLILWFTVLGQVDNTEHVWSVTLLFLLLTGSYIGLSIGVVRQRLRAALGGPGRLLVVGPGALLGAALVYAAATGLTVVPRAIAYAAYLCGPVAILFLREWTRSTSSSFLFGAALAFWLPIEFDLLPALPFPPPDGYDASRVVGIVGALYLFLVACPLPGVGYTFRLELRDVTLAVSTLAAFAVVAVPLGFLTGFLTWHPQITATSVIVAPIMIYLLTAVPEEFLFRGVIQNLITRGWGPRIGLGSAAVIFGAAHLPDVRYVFLATLAGLAYGRVYARSGKITASALTHAGVNWIWALLLSYS